MNSILIAIAVVTGIGLVAAVMLVIASRLMYVPAHEQAEDILAILPGINCGACGYAGCHDYALAIARGQAATNLCVPGGPAASRKISEILGTDFEDVAEMVAVVACHGSYDNTQNKYDYSGIKTCAATSMFHQGRASCAWGCLSYGDCVSVCAYGAISIHNGVAQTDFSLCTGCGACVAKCPKSLIKLLPRSDEQAVVLCSSHDRGAITRKYCIRGCISCGKCVKTCPHGAITIDDFCAVIDHEKCTGCGDCVAVCPVNAIVTVKPKHESVPPQAKS